MAWLTAEPGEPTANGFLFVGLGKGASNLAVCAGGCGAMGSVPCVVDGCSCADCWGGADGGAAGGFGRPGRRASRSLRIVSLFSAGVRDCAIRFMSETTSVLGGFTLSWSGGSDRKVSWFSFGGRMSMRLVDHLGSSTRTTMITVWTTSEIHAA